MTDKEAMAMALEALECANSPNGDYENEIAALKTRLAQPEQEPVGALTLGGVIDTSDGPEYEDWDVEWDAKAIEGLQEKLVTSDSVVVMLYTHPPQRTEQNFCSRCGKRTNDIHTCTPPKENT